MRIFVTGGTGAIGSCAVLALVAAGHAVSTLARTSGKAATLRSQGAQPVSVSLFDREGLTAAFAGHDAVVNLASALPPTHRMIFTSAWTENHRVRAEGSANVVDAALKVGIPQLIQESIVMIYRDGGDRWIDEDWPTDRFPSAAGNHAAEANAQRFAHGGGAAVILHFGIFYGLGAAHSEQIVALARRHIGFQAGRPDSYVSSIHVADAASAVVAALESPSGTYSVVDDQPVTARDNSKAMAAALGTNTWLRAPGRAASLLGQRTTSVTRSLRVSNTRFRATTAWKPRYSSVWEGYRAMAGDRHQQCRRSTAAD
jgi:nucleoside-diphosphate-sugar epimerase